MFGWRSVGLRLDFAKVMAPRTMNTFLSIRNLPKFHAYAPYESPPDWLRPVLRLLPRAFSAVLKKVSLSRMIAWGGS